MEIPVYRIPWMETFLVLNGELLCKTEWYLF
jgi:hypothetical protein